MKWAGGKGQLLTQIEQRLPEELIGGQIRRYVEPFIGGGAVFLHVAQRYAIEQFVLFDINRELVLAYRTIQRAVEALIVRLSELERLYYAEPPEERRAFFYRVRTRFNAGIEAIDFERFDDRWIERTAQLIFLNRTCYNGLFRTNAHSQFNVPFGRYRQPTICMGDNLQAVAAVLARARIESGDFTASAPLADRHSFFYFDPPYRPISKTARFTAYSAQRFDDAAQLRLAEFYRQLHTTGAYLLLSNSDPRNGDPEDDFFERAYAGFAIERVSASRMVNCNANRRGAISELLIANYCVNGL